MWCDEYVFSSGDLSNGINGDNYSFIIEEYFNSDFSERLEHVKLMIDRLTEEKTMLEKYFDN